MFIYHFSVVNWPNIVYVDIYVDLLWLWAKVGSEPPLSEVEIHQSFHFTLAMYCFDAHVTPKQFTFLFVWNSEEILQKTLKNLIQPHSPVLEPTISTPSPRKILDSPKSKGGGGGGFQDLDRNLRRVPSFTHFFFKIKVLIKTQNNSKLQNLGSVAPEQSKPQKKILLAHSSISKFLKF